MGSITVPQACDTQSCEFVAENKITNVLNHYKQLYLKKNPRSAEAHVRACQFLPGGNTRSVLYHDPFPMSMKSGRGCFVTSLDNCEYVDFVSEYTAGLYGHSNPDIQQAIFEAVKMGQNLGAHNQYEAELAEQLVRRFQSIDMVRFCNSGTEANMMAIAVARVYTKRSKILVFREGYHGGTLSFHDPDNPVNLPHDFVVAEYNDIEHTRRLLEDDIAAILVEPMQGAAGHIPASVEFLQYLREAADQIGAILIFDEIVTSRLHVNGLQGRYDIYPDMTTLGKYVGGGFSFGAFGGRKDIMSRLDPRLPASAGGLHHSGTYNNNLFSMAAGVAAGKFLTTDKITALNQMGDQIREGGRAILQAFGLGSVMYLTGLGSLVGVHFGGEHADMLRTAFYFYMLDRSIYVGMRGFLNLNFEHKQVHVAQVLEAFEGFAGSLCSV